MQVIPTDLPDVLLFEPKVFGDARGFFMESYNERVMREAGLDLKGGAFVQDNHSRSSRGVLRGLHYQIQQAQGKLVRVTAGEVWDVVVDIRRSSPAFGRWAGFTLNADNKRMLWVPPGFAHGFVVLSESADFLYKTTDYWAPAFERSIRWNDPQLAITWPLAELAAAGVATPLVSDKDAAGALFADAEVFE
jgi:dTDP-4-dehydrorhamnose 3,5-epimerase